jgi:hypothetical protein
MLKHRCFWQWLHLIQVYGMTRKYTVDDYSLHGKEIRKARSIAPLRHSEPVVLASVRKGTDEPHLTMA